MFCKNLVAVIKSQGKILREIKDEDQNTVRVKFGSEFGILLKNLHTTKALVNVEIDGKDVLNGHSLIIEPNTEMELEGFMDGMRVTNRFKFIEKTQEIKNYRGETASDGIVRITYQFEKIKSTPILPITIPQTIYHWSPPYRNSLKQGECYTSSSPRDMIGSSEISHSVPFRSLTNMVGNHQESENDQGITVHGSQSNQSFITGLVGELDPAKYIIVFILKGKTKENKMVKSIFVKVKQRCEICGRTSKSGNKFCGNCGCALVKF